MYAMLGLGKIYLDRKDFTRAKQFAHEALNLAEEKMPVSTSGTLASS